MILRKFSVCSGIVLALTACVAAFFLALAPARHQLKFGAYLFHLDFNPALTTSSAGSFTYSGQFTGNALADYLLGYPSAAQVGNGNAD